MATIFILIGFLFSFGLSYSIVESATGCASFKCKTSKQEFVSDTCQWLEATTNTYYVLKCADPTLTCQPSGKSLNWTCQMPAVSLKNYYPGEKCEAFTDCDPNFSTDCVNGICQGTAIDSPCDVSDQCVPGSSCQGQAGSKKCAALISADQSGCADDFDCVFTAGCDIESNTDNTQNYCRTLSSKIPGDQLASSYSCNNNVNYICNSGFCGITNDGNTAYCTVEMVTDGKIPKACTESGSSVACNAVPDTKTGYSYPGKCICSQNGAGDGYCDLNPGDSYILDVKKTALKWLFSEAITNCNTKRRFLPNSLTCAKNNWDKDHYDAYFYYHVRESYYIEAYKSEQCVLDTFFSVYEEAKQNYEDDSGLLLEVSLALIILITS